MSRLATATLSLSLFAANAFGADQPAQAPAQPQLADPRCTDQGLQRLMDDQARATNKAVHGVQIVVQDNGQPLVVFSASENTAARAFIAHNVLCETPARPAATVPGVQLNATM